MIKIQVNQPVSMFQMSVIQLSHRENISTITLDRPEKKNAINSEMRQALIETLCSKDALGSVVILESSSDAFCAGMDLSESPGEKEVREIWKIAEAIYNHSSIFIAKVRGVARGGGLTLVNACDLAISDPTASFGMPEIRYGIYPAVVGPTTQAAILKKHVAMMALTGDAITAERAERIGIVNEVVSENQLNKRAQEIAQQLAPLNATALAATKNAVNTFPMSAEERSYGFELAIETNQMLMGADSLDVGEEVYGRY